MKIPIASTFSKCSKKTFNAESRCTSSASRYNVDWTWRGQSWTRQGTGCQG